MSDQKPAEHWPLDWTGQVEFLMTKLQEARKALAEKEAEVERLRAELVNLQGEFDHRTCNVIITPGGQAMACSAGVAEAYAKAKDAGLRRAVEVAEEALSRWELMELTPRQCRERRMAVGLIRSAIEREIAG